MVDKLQTYLVSLGYNIKIDGIIGSETIKAMNDWQKQNGLPILSNLIDKINIRVERVELADTYTRGKLYLDGEYFCDTIEDKYRDLNVEEKVYGQTCIPYGKYNVIINHSPKYGKLMPRLLEVPHFEGILIHSGNSAKDSAGCLLVGEYTGNGIVINSRKTFNDLFNRLIVCNDIEIEII